MMMITTTNLFITILKLTHTHKRTKRMNWMNREYEFNNTTQQKNHTSIENWMMNEWWFLIIIFNYTHTHNCNYTFGLSRSYANQSTSHSTSQPSCHACHSFIIIIIIMVMIGAICHRSFFLYFTLSIIFCQTRKKMFKNFVSFFHHHNYLCFLFTKQRSTVK